MAFHPDHLGLSAEVVIHDLPSPEYDDDSPFSSSATASAAHPSAAFQTSTAPPAAPLNPPIPTLTKYIPAPPSAPYALALALPPSLFTAHSVKATIRIDGTYMTDVIFDRSVYGETGAFEVIRESAAFVEGRDCGQGFRFGELAVDDDAATKKDGLTGVGTEIGTIKVLFHFVTAMKACMKEHMLPDFAKEGRVSEKEVKGLGVSSKTSLDPMQNAPKVEWVNHEYVDGSHLPFAVFEFRYRSEEALKSLHIISRTPSPVPLEDRPEEELSHDERLELIRQFKAEKVNAKKVKKEEFDERISGREKRINDGVGDDGDVEIVREGPSKKRKRGPGEGDEVIFLD